MASDDERRRHYPPYLNENGDSATTGNQNHNHSPSKKPKLSLIADAELRSEFSHHDQSVARINNGSFGCCPASVIASQRLWQLKFLQQPDEFFFNHLKPSILRSRYLIKDLINANHVDEVSIVDNVTTAAAIVLQQTSRAFFEGKFDKGDVVVMLNCAFAAVKKSFEAYVSRAGGRVIEVELPFPTTSNIEIISEFRKALKKCKSDGHRVRLAVIDHVTSMPSVVIPIKELVKVCREGEVDQVFVDGAHAIGCVEVDMKEIGADFYVSNLYKWFFCPPSVAVLYCRKTEKPSDLHHPVVSDEYGKGLAIESAWVGTRDYSAQLVVPEAVEFVNRFEGGIEGIRKRNHEKVVEMGEMLEKSWGTSLGSPPEMCSNMVMVGLPPCLGVHSALDASKLRTHLRNVFNVEVPIYYRAPKDGEINPLTGYARISYQVYNRIDDYYKFRDAVNKLVKDGLSCADLSH